MVVSALWMRDSRVSTSLVPSLHSEKHASKCGSPGLHCVRDLGSLLELVYGPLSSHFIGQYSGTLNAKNLSAVCRTGLNDFRAHAVFLAHAIFSLGTHPLDGPVHI